MFPSLFQSYDQIVDSSKHENLMKAAFVDIGQAMYKSIHRYEQNNKADTTKNGKVELRRPVQRKQVNRLSR